MSHAHPTRTFLILLAILLAVAALAYSWFAPTGGTAQSRAAQGSALAQSADSFNRNDFAGALGSTDSILAADPHNVAALLQKASILAQEGSLTFQEQTYGTQAIEVAQQALALDPNNSEAYRIIGYANEIMQNYAAAHAAYTQSLSLNPENALTLSQDAHAYDLQGELAKAEAGYRAALAIDPSLDQAEMGLGRVLVSQGDLNAALSQFENAYHQSPNLRLRAEAAYSIGIVRGKSGDAISSEEYMRSSITIDPTYALGWAGLGANLFNDAIATSSKNATILDRRQLAQESINDLLKAISLNYNQSAAHLQLGVEMAALGRSQDALKILKGAKGIVPNDITLNASDKQTMLKSIDAALAVVSQRSNTN